MSRIRFTGGAVSGGIAVHQDQRIGLALGVLLLGAAGAFFFRNDSTPPRATPRLRTAKQLDDRIAEKSVSPYLQGIEEVDGSNGTAARNVSDQGGQVLSSDSDDSFPSLEAPDFLLEDSRGPFGSSSLRANPKTHDEADDIPDLAPIPIPDTDEIVSDHSRSEPASSANNVDSAERFHVVQKGETLSSIAARELGSTNRFIELFEANRDQLKDANDVRVGMKLRVPARGAGSSSKSSVGRNKPDLLSDSAPPLLDSKSSRRDVNDLSPNPTEARGENSRSLPTDAVPSPSKKFVPAKRPPFGTRPTEAPNKTSNATEQSGRRLSQLPPDDLRGKVAR